MKDLLFGVIIGIEALVDSWLIMDVLDQRSCHQWGNENFGILIWLFVIVPIMVAILVGVVSKFKNGYKFLKIFSIILAIVTISLFVWYTIGGGSEVSRNCPYANPFS